MELLMERQRTFVWITALLLFPPAAGMIVGMSRAIKALSPPPQVISGAPSAWVAFTADVTITKPNTASVIGRFFRGSDGSRRLETGPRIDDIQVIYILNTAEAQQYVFSSKAGWTVTAVPTLSAGRVLPSTFLPQRPDIVEYPYRLAIKLGESGSLTALAGFRAYQTNGPDGTMRLTVPELNLFDVVINSGNGRSERYSNVSLTVPDPTLFRPPPGVAILRRPPPTSIVR